MLAEEALKLVRKWGGANSEAVLDPHCLQFIHSDLEGFISYKLIGKTAIAFGDPITSPTNKQTLASHFHSYCHQHGYSIIYIAASKKFSDETVKYGLVKAAIEFGPEFYFDPRQNPKELTGTYASLVRRKIRRAEKENTKIYEYIPLNEPIEKQLLSVGEKWLKSREGPQMHISQVNLFAHRLGKRWFYAQKENEIVGVVTINRLEAYQGYLLNHLMVVPEASNGTSELLFTHVLEKLNGENCSYVTVGAVPGEHLQIIHGFNPLITRLAQWGFKTIKKFFKLEGRSKFWEKFSPRSHPSYVLFSSYSPTTILSLIKAISSR
ncbi:MAG: phosphatidylglycerol lysyltransferase domain-containing protein [Parachlamydiaceae bacterium]